MAMEGIDIQKCVVYSSRMVDSCGTIDGLVSCEDKCDFFLDFMLSKISFTAPLNDLQDTCAGRTVRGVHIYKSEKICIADEAFLSPQFFSVA
jgi:hypothetical protein